MRRDLPTSREEDVLQQVISGFGTEQIAAHLGISRRTVEAHLRALFRKADVSSRVQLIAFHQRVNETAERPVVEEAPGAANGPPPPQWQQWLDLVDRDQELRAYADAVHGLVDRQFPLFEERVEITAIVGAADGQDVVIERRWTRPKPYLVYRILGPIVAWPNDPLDRHELTPVCAVDGHDTHLDVHLVRAVDGRPIVMILFQPGLQVETEWEVRYRSPKLWTPLRSSGQDTLSWATATLDQRHPPKINELVLKVVFPRSWTGEGLTERNNLGVVQSDVLPTGQTQLTWHHDASSAAEYKWLLQASPAS
ncbi:MAG: helix-turn-helix domain-containing protein [Pseudonocardiaceae bacterium]